MTLVQLANFVRIAEMQSLSKAAAAIRIAQPALSRQVRALELELGSALLIRHRWGVSLTSAGGLLVLRARRLLGEAEDIRDTLSALATEPTGDVAIGVPTSVSTALIPLLSHRLSVLYPRLTPRFVDGFSAALHSRCLNGDLDLAVLYADRAIGPMATSPLLRETLMLISPATPSAIEPHDGATLQSKRLILPARPNRLRLIIDDLMSAQGVHDVTVVEVDSLPALLAIVERGGGYTVLPYSSVANQVAEGRIRASELAEPRPTRTLLLARPLERRLTAASNAVQTEMRRLVEDLAPTLRWTPVADPDSGI